MTDRRDVSGNLPAEFAERVSDPIDLADQLAWERARRRFQLPRRETMPAFSHITIDTRHFLVVDGTRGPIAYGVDEAATHPAGYLYFPKEGRKTPEKMRGKIFKVIDVVVAEVEEPPVKLQAVYDEWTAACRQEDADRDARYPEAK